MEPEKTSQRVTAQLVAALAVAGLTVKDKDGYRPFVLIPEGYDKEELGTEIEPFLGTLED